MTTSSFFYHKNFSKGYRWNDSQSPLPQLRHSYDSSDFLVVVIDRGSKLDHTAMIGVNEHCFFVLAYKSGVCYHNL